ncbi:hypothetical protein EVAR_22928_1 [Eumeta japonica]|uniref:Uncharacterized protein n=1 Tax=Eumeta variegata TaxID=151549 RepID=A0A4C1UVK4_EUMVA|nr:hypothetical protein EVAR_22928_1 [Eumeta japonica]
MTPIQAVSPSLTAVERVKLGLSNYRSAARTASFRDRSIGVHLSIQSGASAHRRVAERTRVGRASHRRSLAPRYLRPLYGPGPPEGMTMGPVTPTIPFCSTKCLGRTCTK